jgi:V/A-type H+/Na+-transporting ATPase subunit D
MAKIKLTKNELKKQKDSLKLFERYLPTLQLKKQQIQLVIRQIEVQEREKAKEKEHFKKDIDRWIAVFGEEIELHQYVKVQNVEKERGNIAGVDIPIFKSIEFEKIPYDLFATPLWVDRGIEAIQHIISLDEEIAVLQNQLELLGEELRITNQRVNLFEKVKIPEAKENIRKIRIYLGDEQTAAVVRGKIAKNKVARAS